MSIYDVKDVIAVRETSNLYCLECINLDEAEEVTIFTELDRNEEEILQCDECNKII